MTAGFEVGASASLRALHRIPWLSGREGELHAHEYRVEVVVTRSALDGRGMVCDLDVLQAALDDATETVDGTDLERIRPPDADAVTVEILARWFHERLHAAVATAGGEELAVRVWESPTAFGGYRASVSRTSSE